MLLYNTFAPSIICCVYAIRRDASSRKIHSQAHSFAYKMPACETRSRNFCKNDLQLLYALSSLFATSVCREREREIYTQRDTHTLFHSWLHHHLQHHPSIAWMRLLNLETSKKGQWWAFDVTFGAWNFGGDRFRAFDLARLEGKTTGILNFVFCKIFLFFYRNTFFMIFEKQTDRHFNDKSASWYFWKCISSNWAFP